MPKKDDQPDELPKKVDDWKAPWEVDKEGNDIPEDDQDLDAGRLKKYLFGLLTDKNRLRGQVNTLTEEKTTLETQIAEATDETKVKKLQEDLAAAQKERDDAKSGSAVELIKLQVALEKGLTPRQVKRLVGSTKEELEADADEILEDFGTAKTDEVDEDGKPVVRSTPRRVIKPGTKQEQDPPPKEIDPQKWAEDYARRKQLGYA